MKAVLISQEGVQFELQEAELYSIGKSPDDNIYISHSEVAPHHAQLSYDNEKNAWKITPQNLGRTYVTRHNKTNPLNPLTPIYLQNDDLIILSYGSFVRAAMHGLPKHKSPYALQKDFSEIPVHRWKPPKNFSVYQGLPFPRITLASFGYKIRFKESEEPSPKLRHPPEPVEESVRLEHTKNIIEPVQK